MTDSMTINSLILNYNLIYAMVRSLYFSAEMTNWQTAYPIYAILVMNR